MVFTESEIAYLGSQRLGRLATAQDSGVLQVSPVGFSYNSAMLAAERRCRSWTPRRGWSCLR